MTIIEPRSGCPECRCFASTTGSSVAAGLADETDGDSSADASAAAPSALVGSVVAGAVLVCAVIAVVVVAAVRRRRAAALGRRTAFEWDVTN